MDAPRVEMWTVGGLLTVMSLVGSFVRIVR